MKRDEDLDGRLRDALAAQVEDVEAAPDALPRIRERTRARRWHWLPVFATAGAVAAAIALGVVMFVPDRSPSPAPLGTAVSAPPETAPATGTSPGPSAARSQASEPSSTTGTSVLANVPVYYTRQGRLFREYHRLRVEPDTVTGRVAAAVTEMLRDGSAVDPQYTSLWPAGVAVRGVSIDGGVATVDLSGAGAAPRGPATLAVQQLVWTVSAAVAETPVGRIDGVRLRVGGAPVASLWGVVETDRLLRQAPQVDVLAPVWVIEPHQGATVGRTFTVHVAGTVFEATVQVRIRAGEKVVEERIVTLSVGAPERGDAKPRFTVPPGRYTVEAYFLSAEDGSVQWLDDHDFTVG